MDVQYQKRTLQTKGTCLSPRGPLPAPAPAPISWSMVAILRDSVAVFVVRTCPRAIPLAMITMRKSVHGFLFLSYMSMGLRLTTLRVAGAPLYIYRHRLKHFQFRLGRGEEGLGKLMWKRIPNSRVLLLGSMQCFRSLR